MLGSSAPRVSQQSMPSVRVLRDIAALSRCRKSGRLALLGVSALVWLNIIESGSCRRHQMRGLRLAEQEAVNALLHRMIGLGHTLVLAQMLEP